MTTPDFVLELRRHIGNAPLWMPGCTAVVTRPRRDAPGIDVLCVRRADNGAWTPVTGIVDPGEEPAAACEREVLEEAGVVARARRVVSLEVVGPVTYANGDVSTYLDTAFWLEWVSGEPYPADGENTAARFAPGDRLPEMNERFRRVISRALSGAPEAQFVAAGR
ncbi:MAG: NUDIX domain-containing protein [Actinomyces sp.]|jgi:8-oxo-dGTP pyrophosphatase MutT (NUDIX family)|nr:NUDIX domain-containing protein [Actinomyces sp.]MCI1642388.1 NUDIX domain-containing protein [Actinomyces sp.]MCI1662954.1 NUDIX domain-containing protein [Actinomyces sp.]MCI1691548.1 NUDIX domain-containing protein [Actinomyces sp.]MCI1787158.1 NUDIX domain-containing protein [Actinomyces sp.]MCI1829552.1 NUDIX domain-containing protein [Actinomyces sp.]